jgi:hypothetical protein
LASTVVDAEMFTTASVTLSARSAIVSGPRARTGADRVKAAAKTAAAKARPAPRGARVPVMKLKTSAMVV